MVTPAQPDHNVQLWLARQSILHTWLQLAGMA